MKLPLSILFCLMIYGVKAQDSIPILKDVVVSVAGMPSSEAVQMQRIRTGLKLQASDRAFTVTSFHIGWGDVNGTYHERRIDGDSIGPSILKSIQLTPMQPVLFFDQIMIVKEGRTYSVKPIFIRVDDEFDKYITAKNPVVCHTAEGELSCYYEGNYLLQFANNAFTGFITADSLVRYDESERKIYIAKSSKLSIQLLKKSIVIESSAGKQELDSLQTSKLELDGIKLDFSHSKFSDTISFLAGRKQFFLLIDTWEKTWRWKIVARTSSHLFYLNYGYKTNRLESIGIQDNYLKSGMLLSTRFRNNKGLWMLKSSYVEEQLRNDGRRYITEVPLANAYYYSYDRSGKLNTKDAKGKIRYCNCNNGSFPKNSD